MEKASQRPQPRQGGYWAEVRRHFSEQMVNLTPTSVLALRLGLFMGPAILLPTLYEHGVEGQPVESVFLDLVLPILACGVLPIFAFFGLRIRRRALDAR